MTVESARISDYGLWESDLTAQWCATRKRWSRVRAVSGRVFWIESDPARGRSVLISGDAAGGRPSALELGEGYSPSSLVHENYGGVPYYVTGEESYFVNGSDQGIYRWRRGDEPELLVREDGLRFIDPWPDARHNRILCVTEDHRGGGEPVTAISAIPLEGQDPVRVLVEGADFYSSARTSADGSRLAWTEWSHPNMPWNGTALFVAELGDDGSVISKTMIAGGAEESVSAPTWDADGALWFLSDRSSWWNLYRWCPETREAEILFAVDADLCRPPWEIGASPYALIPGGGALCVLRAQGVASLAVLTSQGVRIIESEFDDYAELWASEGRVYTVGESFRTAPTILEIDPKYGRVAPLYHDSAQDSDSPALSRPERIRFTTPDGEIAHGFFYPPAASPDPETAPPPLVINIHGGPTSAVNTGFKPELQFFATRGFAVLDLNYRGSTGFGRGYWERLYGNWGVVDVQDCLGAVDFLAKAGWADPSRIVLRGGSAGGYTTLMALAHSDAFRAGASYYGVSDLELMERETHKFESRYTTRLACGDTRSEAVLKERSPSQWANAINAPVLFLQGSEDPVVPPNQSTLMHEQLTARNVPSAIKIFDGEAHGFTSAETTRFSLEAELTFFCRVLRIPRSDLQELEITHADLL